MQIIVCAREVSDQPQDWKESQDGHNVRIAGTLVRSPQNNGSNIICLPLASISIQCAVHLDVDPIDEPSIDRVQ